MLRSLLIILLMAGTVVAGSDPKPGDWKARRYGDSDETKADSGGKASGNAGTMEVFEHAVKTAVRALAMSDPLSANQDGTATDVDTVWYELRLSGSEGVSTPTWRLETTIAGDGVAEAQTIIQGTAWSESVEAIKVTGDNTNQAAGELAVSDSGAESISIGFPITLNMPMTKTTRKKGNDVYVVKQPKVSQGSGMVCRVRIETYAKAHSTATTKAGHASTSIVSGLRVKLEMKGTTVAPTGEEVHDVFRIVAGGIPHITASKTEEPRGGLEWEREEIPTDTPTDEERGIDPDAEEESGETSTDPTTDGSTADPTTEETGSSDTGD